MNEYESYILSKMTENRSTGIGLYADLSPMLYDFQKSIVEWAVQRGKAAVFAECGLGKTAIQLEWAKQIALHSGGPVLILAPLAVSGQTKLEGEKFGIEVHHVRDGSEVGNGIYVTNYERLHRFNPKIFSGVVLDESSILKAFMGKTKRTIMDAFLETPFKLACTATPAPNDYLELGNHAQFLDVMNSNEMIARWFVNNPMEAGDYRLKKHGAKDYWAWMTSWAVSMRTPADIGYESEAGQFTLPPLTIKTHEVKVDWSRASEGKIFREPLLNATQMHREMRLTCKDRAACVADLMEGGESPRITWCNTNYEADAIMAMLHGAVEVRGSMTPELKEGILLDFAQGRIPVMVTKPSVAGFGMNFQVCSKMAFLGLSYSYEQFYQAVRRCFRFGQTKPVECHVVIAETEGNVLKAIQEKRKAHEEMQDEMIEAMKETGLNGTIERKRLKVMEEKKVEQSDNWRMILGDCVTSLGDIQDDSIGLSIFSPPFSNLYIYSDSIRDMGNTEGDQDFMRHFSFLVPELYRVTIPGRICAIHCKDLPLYKGRDGAAGLRDFPGRIIAAMESAGWVYHSRVTIWKDPVIEMQRTKNHGLLYKELRKNSTSSRMGMADYIVAFRKWREGDPLSGFEYPVAHTKEEFPLEQWQKWASPVWDDIRQTDVLHAKGCKESDDERHICPLQLGVIERCIALWSNQGDLILDPFAGIGSTGYQALKMSRRFIGIELKEGYWKTSIKNLKGAERTGQANLFMKSDMAVHEPLEREAHP